MEYHHTCTLTCEGPGRVLHVYIVPTMLAELFYPFQDGDTSLHIAVRKGHATCAERLLSTPGIEVNIKDKVSWSTVVA